MWVCGFTCPHLADHSKYISEYKKNFIPVYGPEMDKDINIIQPKQKFKLGGFTIMTLPVKHDVPCYAYLINHEETGLIFFCTDTHLIPYTLKGINQLIIEANFDAEKLDNNVLNGYLPAIVRKRVLNSHLSLDGCMEFLKKNDLSQVSNIVLIHLSDGNSDSRNFKKQVEELSGKKVYIAKKGLSMEFDKEPF